MIAYDPRSILRSAVGVCSLLVIAGRLAAQDPPEKVRTICDNTDPRLGCPGETCLCIPDTFEIVFDGDSDSVYSYETYADGMTFRARVVSEVQTEKVRGWSYGVRHDPVALEVLSADIGGTDAEALFNNGFNLTDTKRVQTCTDPACSQATRIDGGGWISAVVLAFVVPVEVPRGRRSLAQAEYRLLEDVGPDGTTVEITDRLAQTLGPPISIVVTVDRYSRSWTTAVDGWVRAAGGGPLFRRGDVGVTGEAGDEHPADGFLNVTDPVRILRRLFGGFGIDLDCEKAADADDSGTVEVSDAIHLLHFLFLGEAPPAAPFPEPGPDPTADDLGCRISA